MAGPLRIESAMPIQPATDRLGSVVRRLRGRLARSRDRAAVGRAAAETMAMAERVRRQLSIAWVTLADTADSVTYINWE